MEATDALRRVESQLEMVRGRRARRLIERWGQECPLLAPGRLISPRDVPPWVWTLDRDEADAVLRALVGLAQAGDEVAALAVLVCLRPGLYAIVGRMRVPVDEVVAEASVIILEFPLARRRRVAAGLVLDVRHRFWQQRHNKPEILDGDTRMLLEAVPAPVALGVHMSSAEQLFRLVCGAWRAGRLGPDEACLIIETRILGDTVASAAARHGMTPRAAFDRRQYAEIRLARAAA